MPLPKTQVSVNIFLFVCCRKTTNTKWKLTKKIKVKAKKKLITAIVPKTKTNPVFFWASINTFLIMPKNIIKIQAQQILFNYTFLFKKQSKIGPLKTKQKQFLLMPTVSLKPKYSDRQKNKKIKKQKLNFNHWMYLPLNPFIGTNKVIVVTHNLYTTILLKNFNRMLKTGIKMFPFLKLNRVATQLTAAIQLLLVYKDTSALLVFIKSVFQAVHYSLHAQYFVFVNYLIQFVLGPQLYHFNCLGLKALFRGKLAVGGNSRKSVQRIFFGVSSSSSKFVKIHKSFAPIKTKTGVIGFWLFLTW